MNLILSKDCTRSLDVAIAEERVRYASERLDFHSFFWRTTVPELQKIIRRETEPPDPDEVTRKNLIDELFAAQQQGPHRLWELLILQVVEPALVKRRQALLPEDDPHLDELVVSTFVDALQYIPFSVWYEDAQSYVLRISRYALARKLRKERGQTKREAARVAASARKARAASPDAEPAVAAKSEVP